MEFHGEELKQSFIDVDSNDDFMKLAQLLADATKRYGVPYLVGEGKDFDAIQQIVKKNKSQENIEKIRQNYRFPKNVRKGMDLNDANGPSTLATNSNAHASCF